MELSQAAAYAAFAAIVTLVASAVALALFFGGAGAVWGPINDVFVALTTLLLVLPMVAILRGRAEEAAGWFAIVTVLAIAGAVLIAVGQLLLVAGVIDLQASFVTGGLGILPVLVWMAALTYLVLSGGVALPSLVGYLGAGVLAIAPLLTIIYAAVPVAGIILAAALVLVLSGWLWAIATSFA